MSGAQKILLHPYRGTTRTENLNAGDVLRPTEKSPVSLRLLPVHGSHKKITPRGEIDNRSPLTDLDLPGKIDF